MTVDLSIQRQLQDIAGNRGFILHRKGKITNCDAKIARLLGYKDQGDLIGSRISDFLITRDRGSLKKVLRQTGKKSGQSLLFENRYGEPFDFEIENSEVEGMEEQILIVKAHTRLLQEGKRVHEIVRWFHSLINNIPGVVFRCRNDEFWTMEFISKGCLDLIGYHPDDLMFNNKLSFSSLIPEPDTMKITRAINRSFEKDSPYDIIYRIQTRTGKMKWVREKGIGIRDDSGKVTHIEGFISDITRLTMAEQRLKLQNQRLERKVNIRTKRISQIHTQLEERTKKITDSIRYARRVQSSLFSDEKKLIHRIPSSFLINLPKDIISGDFFWMYEVGDEFLFALADCTGHGVPGALLSIICNSALNRSIREFGLKKPSDILNKVRELIVENFEKSQWEVLEGMDVALCSMNSKKFSVQYSGANIPICYIIGKNYFKSLSIPDRCRIHENDRFCLIEVRADKQPISNFPIQTSFTNMQLTLKKGCGIYAFSDGFADQFGGPRSLKYKQGNLKELLLSTHHLPIHEQRNALVQTFMDWRGGGEQTDDVSVLGIRI